MYILKIIGIILLILLGILLLLLFFILFSPIFYEVKVNKTNEIHICAKFKWLKGILNGGYIHEEKEKKEVYIKLLWWFLYKEYEEYKLVEEKDIEEKDIEEKDIEEKKDTLKKHKNIKTVQHTKKISMPAEKISDGVEQLGKGISYEAEEQIKIKDSFGLKDVQITKDLMETIKDTLIKVYKHIKPKRIYIKGKYGFEDPCYTGYVYAGISLIYPHVDMDLFEVEPDFERKVLNGTIDLNGRVLIGALLKSIIIFIRKPSIKNIIQIYKKKRKGEI